MSSADHENSEIYCPGGYHPVEIGDLFGNRYLVVQKLGWGNTSTVWLCLDQNHGSYVAMKVKKSAANYTEAALDEIMLLSKVASKCKSPVWVELTKQYHPEQINEISERGVTAGHTYVVQLLNTFSHSGPNGTHICLIFEVLGVNLLEIIKLYNYKGVPAHLCRRISKQVLIGLDYLHRVCGIIHADLKPENIIIQLTQAQIKELFIKAKIVAREPLVVVVVKDTEIPLFNEIKEIEASKQMSVNVWKMTENKIQRKETTGDEKSIESLNKEDEESKYSPEKLLMEESSESKKDRLRPRLVKLWERLC